MLGTRPDIAFAVSVISRFSANPTKAHMEIVKRVFRYLKGTSSMGLVFRGTLQPLSGYTDSDYAGDHDIRRSTSGYIFNLGSAAISWSSKRQPTVTLSSCEAEYVGQTNATKEAIWLQGFLRQIHPDLDPGFGDMIIYGDNQGAIALAKNNVFHGRTKHIKTRHHFVREKVADGSVELRYVHTSEMVADGLNKPLPRDPFQRFGKAVGTECWCGSCGSCGSFDYPYSGGDIVVIFTYFGSFSLFGPYYRQSVTVITFYFSFSASLLSHILASPPAIWSFALLVRLPYHSHFCLCFHLSQLTLMTKRVSYVAC